MKIPLLWVTTPCRLAYNGIRNGDYIPVYKVSRPRRPKTSSALLWELQISLSFDHCLQLNSGTAGSVCLSFDSKSSTQTSNKAKEKKVPTILAGNGSLLQQLVHLIRIPTECYVNRQVQKTSRPTNHIHRARKYTRRVRKVKIHHA
jgi:hypothetical protein